MAIKGLDTKDLALRMRYEVGTQYSSLQYAHVKLEPVGKNGQGYYSAYGILDRMSVQCQIDSDRPGESYAHSVRFDRVDDMEEAETVLRIYRAIEAAYKKHRETFGYASVATFGQYAALVARTLGISVLRVPSRYSDWRDVSIGDGVDIIDSTVRAAFREEVTA